MHEWYFSSIEGCNFSPNTYLFFFVHLLWVDNNNYNTLRVRQMPIINVDSSIIYTFLLFLVDSFKVDCNFKFFCWFLLELLLVIAPLFIRVSPVPEISWGKVPVFLTVPEAHGVVKGRWLASQAFVKWLFLAGVLYRFWGESGSRVPMYPLNGLMCFWLFLFVRSKAICVQKVVFSVMCIFLFFHLYEYVNMCIYFFKVFVYTCRTFTTQDLLGKLPNGWVSRWWSLGNS